MKGILTEHNKLLHSKLSKDLWNNVPDALILQFIMSVSIEGIDIQWRTSDTVNFSLQPQESSTIH